MLQPERNICSFIDIALRLCVHLTSRNVRLWFVYTVGLALVVCTIFSVLKFLTALIFVITINFLTCIR